jgi:hypothetical protein
MGMTIFASKYGRTWLAFLNKSCHLGSLQAATGGEVHELSIFYLISYGLFQKPPYTVTHPYPCTSTYHPTADLCCNLEKCRDPLLPL